MITAVASHVAKETISDDIHYTLKLFSHLWRVFFRFRKVQVDNVYELSNRDSYSIVALTVLPLLDAIQCLDRSVSRPSRAANIGCSI